MAVQDGKDQNVVVLNLVENDVTFMFVAPDTRRDGVCRSAHAGMFGQQSKDALQFGFVKPRLSRPKGLESI